MSTQSKTIKPNRFDEAKKVIGERKINTPEEINESEAHLIHLAVIKSTPDFQNFEFIHSLKVHKLTQESFVAMEEQLKTFEGAMVVLHDGKKWLAEAPKRKNEDEQKAKEDQAKADQDKADAQKLIDDEKQEALNNKRALDEANKKAEDLQKKLDELKKDQKENAAKNVEVNDEKVIDIKKEK